MSTDIPADLTGPGSRRHTDSAWRHDPVRVPVGALLPPDSPRLTGENAAHVRMLATSSIAFPPIIVHRATLRVIDGTHRLRATQLRGDKLIEIQFFDGPSEDAFVLAVRMNVERPGLPLSLSDRTAAAERILRSHRQWSDRAIAAVTGLSHKTVGSIRRRSSGELTQSPARVGRDGRVRPVNGGENRRQAGELIARRPEASPREIAQLVGISPQTARDVRNRIHRGDDPALPTQRREPPHGPPVPPDGGVADEDAAAIMLTLRRDPSLRLSEAGRILLRLLEAFTVTPQQWESLINGLPSHSTDQVAAAARGCAQVWLDVATHLEQSRRPTQPGTTTSPAPVPRHGSSCQAM
ncbi:streptomycin biosynthesis protein [Actinophytocola sp.]|uniref:ParB/RepB/Spo0J family partition protein n=1 Tax=Actinophytocola sp. TaxID=1872138 RepID=UPI002D800A0F|nr:streptomycin biosynthesis protein [Actinophytocola sp.]HET9137904.1 streptomycin biosynthesis protein [Actinophytocola sp.]